MCFSLLPLLTRNRKPEFKQVIEICGRLPVALKVVAGMIACGQKWGQLLDDLQGGSELDAFVVFVYPCRTSDAYTDSGTGIRTHTLKHRILSREPADAFASRSHNSYSGKNENIR